MNQAADNLSHHRELPVSLTAARAASTERHTHLAIGQAAESGVGSQSNDEAWTALGVLPFSSWKEALHVLEKKIARLQPTSAGRFGLWFAPMPLESIQQRGSEIRLRFACSSQKRKQEVLILQPVLEDLLAAEYFPGRRVRVELSEPYDELLGSTNPATNGEGAPGSPPDGKPQNSTDTSHNQTASPQPAAPAAARPFGAADISATGDHLNFYRQKTMRADGDAIGDEDLQSVLKALKVRQPQAMAALEQERGAQLNTLPTAAGLPAPESGSQLTPRPASAPSAATRLDEILLEPAYATTYDELVRAHSAVYLPAYFVRHLRHMGAADGLRYMALRQVAYLHGLREPGGAQLLPVTVKELSRWSTLQPRRIYGGLEDPDSYLFLLAGKAPYLDYYASRPPASRWEDESGYHWKGGGRDGGREYCVWKRAGQATNDCSQLLPDRASGELQWRQAPLIYRVQLSMPLCPEDEQTLRTTLLQFGVRDDPLRAIQQCLALPRSELLPDRPARLSSLPRKLYTVQELVMECWGRMEERELAARVAVQAKLLETHLLQPEHDLLKIPFYLLEKWGQYLSPAQLWTAILAMDRVYAAGSEDAYRDTTMLRNGIKDMTLWTEDQYSKGAARKITKWLYPFNITNGSNDSQEEKDPPAGEHFNPWFSVFVSEILPENGARVKNADNSVQMKLRVLPLVPLCPQDTLHFARKMGLERLAVRDAAGQTLALEITEEDLAVYLSDGRTLRYSHTGELRFGEAGSVRLRARDRQLNGIDLLTGEDFYAAPGWPGALFGRLENQAGALSGSLESEPGALFDYLENGSGALSGNLENSAGALFGELTLEPGALFGLLLKLLILNLYGIKQNTDSEKPPSKNLRPENVDALEQFGSRQGQYIQWGRVTAESDWDFGSLVKSLGITDVKSLAEKGVTALALASTALELYAMPGERFTSGRVAVLVARLRSIPHPEAGIYMRIAEQGPEPVQDCLRRAILNVSPLLNEPDWDQTLGKARRDELIELAERLGLARVFRE